ncbi:MAG: GNAT family N-acetyltransferase [Sulfolobales archaeon]|nr:GNAT family N-acetyltransferase [Sulfolobales archaeon]MDW8082859.1 GNAT family N-acetyltransferase [Sulfolobales archaeon]
MSEDSLSVVEVDSSDYGLVKKVVELVEKTMGMWQAHYASTCFNQKICRSLAIASEKLLGVVLFYTAQLELDRSLGVIYYVVVREEYRGRGFGKVLVSSAEYLLEDAGVDLVVATARSENTPSRNLFNSLGYSEISLHAIEEIYGELLTKLTCGYEDDLVFFKNMRASLTEVLSVLSLESNLKKIEELWYTLCYRPWREMRSSRHMQQI